MYVYNKVLLKKKKKVNLDIIPVQYTVQTQLDS